QGRAQDERELRRFLLFLLLAFRPDGRIVVLGLAPTARLLGSHGRGFRRLGAARRRSRRNGGAIAGRRDEEALAAFGTLRLLAGESIRELQGSAAMAATHGDRHEGAPSEVRCDATPRENDQRKRFRTECQTTRRGNALRPTIARGLVCRRHG